ncbi:type III pantothenate kinase [Marinobacter confluentis]|uniref:Type III pantothenate kinase n=1 Tax=Marinobacter confluentis TaxID=1697557 RepID=A0A4Z1BGS4_9GAMM|nr:type III pantothenate kinase [Marinobacter confluentis]TGN38596.1 type III pantothenate kinase [Marinobacter confluentis]
MRLLIDAGNTRLKWRLDQQGDVVTGGACLFDSRQWLDELSPFGARIESISVSTVISEARRSVLVSQLVDLSGAPISFYWAESLRGGLRNAYSDVEKMGADRWHAMYAAWQQGLDGFAVVDAGSAITVDYVTGDGDHLGGYILPGKQMMLRSLQQDAARIGFESIDAGAGDPGRSTTECVQHGLVWLWEGLIRHLVADCERYRLQRIVCTGGDAVALLAAGLPGQHEPDLVLSGLAAIDSEAAGS